MAKVLLTHCNHLFYDRKQVRKMQPYPPLQTLIVAALLRREGFGVALFDATLEEPEQGFREALSRHQPDVVALCEDNFNFLTKMCLTRNRELAFAMARLAKEQGIPVLANSSDASQQPAVYLQNGVDYIILGEVELTLIELLRTLPAGHRTGLEGIRGLAYVSPASGKIRCNPPRQPIATLDELPMPAWDMVDMESYRAAWREAHGYFSLNMVSSRGCPFRCNWCAKPIHGQSYHSRAAERVAREMRFLKTNYAPDQIWFADDIFALSPSWAASFAEAVEKLDARIPFKMQSRCDLMTRDTAAALKRAGCEEIWMGAESGSQRVLDAMDKGIRVGDIYRARENLRRHKIRACYFLQFGYPGERWEDIQQTIRMVRETEPDDVGISVSYPLPGTEFHRRVAAELGSKRNWAESGDLAMMFRGAYSNGFYRALHDAIHRELEIRRATNGRLVEAQLLHDIWHEVEELRSTTINPSPTLIWTCS